MIKLFRNLRKSFISEGNTQKYLKYAIGEILLVVVGILIALQVSNWNTKKKLEKKELEFLEHIYGDLENVLSDMSGDLYSLQLGERSHYRILDYISKNAQYQDSMCFDFYWLAKDEYIYPFRSTYDAIKEEGFAIIKNDTLRQGIQAAFENIFPRISKQNPFYPDIEVFYSEYYQENFKANRNTELELTETFPDFTLQYPYTKVVNKKEHKVTVGYVPLNFEKIKTDPKFSVLMRQSYLYRAYKINRYKGGQNFINRLKEVIQRELENRK